MFENGLEKRGQAQEADAQKKNSAFQGFGMIEEDNKSQNRQTGERQQSFANLPCIFQLIENGFYQREKIVQSPVEDQTGRGGIEENQEKQCHAVELDLGLHGEALQIDGAGDHVDQRHQDGQGIERKIAQNNKTVRCPKIGDWTEGSSAQKLGAG